MAGNDAATSKQQLLQLLDAVRTGEQLQATMANLKPCCVHVPHVGAPSVHVFETIEALRDFLIEQQKQPRVFCCPFFGEPWEITTGRLPYLVAPDGRDWLLVPPEARGHGQRVANMYRPQPQDDELPPEPELPQ